ncbi:MAG TPA: Uma2 family endonuclease [Tepidisphaeraceae bacterium]|nr:Uma2 family endonuclease [Tepidisphaeraceae bacterium]
MTVASLPSPAGPQHVVLDDVSWESYENLLNEIGDRPVFVSFCRGSLEIMPPLPEHELEKKALGSLLELVALETKMPMRRFGSTTFRSKDDQVGLEPDECYYIRNEARVRKMRRFDPKVYPPPDLSIEIEITRRSVPRQPIYAALGVPELWRYDGARLTVLILSQGTYVPTQVSPTFPFLPLDGLVAYVARMLGDEEQNAVIEEFRAWVRQLPK